MEMVVGGSTGTGARCVGNRVVGTVSVCQKICTTRITRRTITTDQHLLGTKPTDTGDHGTGTGDHEYGESSGRTGCCGSGGAVCIYRAIISLEYMKQSLLSLRSISAGIIALLVIFGATQTITVSHAQTAPAYTVTGVAFSDIPNNSDQGVSAGNPYGGRGLGAITMSGPGFGVTLDPSSGKFSGKAYNALAGYVDFAPSGLTGASVAKSCLDDKNAPCPVTGFMRFDAYTDPQSGGWDGQVQMSDSSWTKGVELGKEIAGVRTMSGFAWGGDVVGWVDFKDVKVIINDLCTNLDNAQNSVPDGYVKVPALPADQPGICKETGDKGCKIVGDPNYNETATIENNTLCFCPNGDYNQTTKQCGDVPPPPPSCPTPAPNPNFPGMPGTPGYNASCPITCKSPTKWNNTLQRCELDNGDVCPDTRVDNPLHDESGKIDPQTRDVQNNYPAGYSLYGNRCGIAGCDIKSAKNYSGTDTNWTIRICTFCPKGQKAVNGECVACIDPNDKTECPLPPKGFISPVTKEV